MRVLILSLVGLILISLITGCTIERKPGAPKPSDRIPTSRPNPEVDDDFGKGGFIIVTLSDVDKLSLIDMRTYEIGDTVDTGVNPVQAAIAPDASNYYVLMATRDEDLDDDELPNPLNHNAIWTWNTDNHRIRGKTSVTTAVDEAYCTALTINSSGRHYFFTDSVNNTLTIRETTGNQKELARITVGENPTDVIICPEDRYIVTINSGIEPESDSGAVSVIYQLSQEEVHRINVGGIPFSGCFNPHNQKLYVTIQDSNEVKEIDYRNGNIDRVYSVGPNPKGIAVSADGDSLFVASHDENNVYVLDLHTGESQPAFNTGKGPTYMLTDNHGQFLLVANKLDKSLTAINIPQEKIIKTISLDGTPSSIAIWTPIAAREMVSSEPETEASETAADKRDILTPIGVSEAAPGTVDSTR